MTSFFEEDDSLTFGKGLGERSNGVSSGVGAADDDDGIEICHGCCGSLVKLIASGIEVLNGIEVRLRNVGYMAKSVALRVDGRS